MDMYQNICGLHFAEGYDEYFEDVAFLHVKPGEEQRIKLETQSGKASPRQVKEKSP